MNTKMVQICYLLGISLLLTSILYFFASNWPYFERLTKISLVLLLLILFYALHLILKRWATWQPFLSNWALIGASIVFGIAVALIGQTYNSHADSYELFIIWLIPVLLLAIMTRYVPLYVLSYVLSQLAMLLFISPTSFFKQWEEGQLLLLLSSVILFNAFLFIFSYYHIVKSKTILYLTYMMFHLLFFYVVANDALPLHLTLNIIYTVLLISAGYYWAKQSLHKGLLTVTSIFASIFILFRVFNWVMRYYGELVLYLLLFLAVALTLVGGIIAGLLNKNKMNRYLAGTITISITIVTALFAIVAISGIFFIFLPDATADSLYLFAMIVLIVPGLFAKMPGQYRYSLLGTGFLLAFVTGIISQQIFYLFLLLLPLGIGIYVIKQTGVKMLAYLFANVVAAYIMLDVFSIHAMALVLLFLNAGYYLIIVKERATNHTAFLIAAVSLLILTFINTALGLQFIYNSVFLFGVPLFIFILNKNEEKAESVVMLVLWFVYLGYQYYDYLWSLVHKSIAALILGLVFITVAYLFDRPNKTAAPTGSVVTYRTSILISIIILQLSFISFQAYTNEKLLQEGDQIKLELTPVDPRSMLQGDYLRLNYEISDIDEPSLQGKVKIVLREENGLYHYAGFYRKEGKWNKDYHALPEDVIMNGNANGNGQIKYGIETFFIPDGTGAGLENKAEYAFVRVSKSGDAILEDVK